jgi:chromosome segregation ATPase
MAEADNERLRPLVTGLRQDLRAVQIEKEKQREEVAGLRAHMDKMQQDRAGTIETMVKNRTAQLRGDLEEAHHKLRVEQANNERLHEHLDEEAKSARAAKEAVQKLQKQARELSDKLRVNQRENERMRKEPARNNEKGINGLPKPFRK